MKTLFNVKNVLIAAGIASIALLNSCNTKTKDCDGGCPTGQICQDGQCIDDPSTGETKQVTGFITTNTKWTADNYYVLNGRVVVRAGATLTIEPGTIIKGANGTGTNASVLIVERGAKIDARGTAAKPIIFTSVEDNIKIGEKAGTNFNEKVNEKWGGVIVLGKAPVSTQTGNVEGQIEGIPANETYGVYGGTDPADNSGYLEYISIRHGGITIGNGNEINGLTLGGVGTGTSVHHIEIVGNLDDGIELFGGTVNVTDAIIYYVGDDAFDIDQNWSGTGSNILTITGNGVGTDEALELDGPEGSTYTTGMFTITNSTFINEGTEGSAGDLKDKTQGQISNCAFIGYTKHLKLRASFSDTTACTPKNDAFLYATQTSPKLTIFNCEIVSTTATLSMLADAYNGSGGTCIGATEQAALDNAISNSSNNVVPTRTKGANINAFKDWTWVSVKGKL